METRAWLTRGTALADGRIINSSYVLQELWQMYTTAGGGWALAVSEELYRFWVSRDFLEEGLLEPLPMENGESIYTIGTCEGEWVFSVMYGPYIPVSAAALALGKALKASMARTTLSLSEGILISRFGLVLPVPCEEKREPESILGCWICGGMNIMLTDTGRIRRFASWLTDSVRIDLLTLFDLREQSAQETDRVLAMPESWRQREEAQKRRGTQQQLRSEEEQGMAWQQGNGEIQVQRRERAEGPFTLPGRPMLEKFFREELLDVIDREEEYRRFGVGFPGATLLYGPPGSGKTFAVERLAEYLGWPVFRITSGTVGSKYIHETSRKISRMFDLAITNAPSVLIIDELETFLSSREDARGSEEIHMEEVGEFLRRIPDAAQKKVLLFGMTNLFEKIDKAVLRKGRFDHILEVGMPSGEEVQDVLRSILKNLPAAEDLRLEKIAGQLAGRPLSDAAFVVTEAGRICVRDRKPAIDEESLRKAMEKLTPRDKARRRIGFV